MPGAVESFLSAFQNLSAMERQKQQDKQALVQQTVENELAKHRQEQESQRIQMEGQHYKAQEAQAAATEKDRQQKEARLQTASEERAKDRSQRTAIAQKNLERLQSHVPVEIWKTTEQGRLRVLSQALQGGMEYPDALLMSHEWAANELGRAAEQTSPTVKPDMSTLGMIGKSFAGTETPSPRPNYQGPLPLVAARMGNMVAQTKFKEASTKQLNDLMQTNAELKAAEAHLKEAQISESHVRAKLAPERLGLDKKRLALDDWYKHNEINLQQTRAAIEKMKVWQTGSQNDRTFALQQATRMDQWLKPMLDSFTREYEKASAVERDAGKNIQGAKTLSEALTKVQKQRQLTTQEQQSLVVAQQSLVEWQAKMPGLVSERKRLGHQVNEIMNQRHQAEGLYKQSMTKSGTAQPFRTLPTGSGALPKLILDRDINKAVLRDRAVRSTPQVRKRKNIREMSNDELLRTLAR